MHCVVQCVCVLMGYSYVCSYVSECVWACVLCFFNIHYFTGCSVLNIVSGVGQFGSSLKVEI